MHDRLESADHGKKLAPAVTVKTAFDVKSYYTAHAGRKRGRRTKSKSSMPTAGGGESGPLRHIFAAYAQLFSPQHALHRGNPSMNEVARVGRTLHLGEAMFLFRDFDVVPSLLSPGEVRARGGQGDTQR